MTLLFFPCKKICEVPIFQIQKELITIFKNWGIPKRIKVDNGRPFGDPQMELIPILALWLIAMGIKMTWNRPATPQDNARVERSQGVMARWTNFPTCQDGHDLQARLWREAEFHNYHFPIRRWKKRKRIEMFPKLAYTGRAWNPNDFKLNRALLFLAKGSWERKVSAKGQINFYGQKTSVGTVYKNQIVSIKLNPREKQWYIFNIKGQLVQKKNIPFSMQSLWKLDYQ